MFFVPKSRGRDAVETAISLHSFPIAKHEPPRRGTEKVLGCPAQSRKTSSVHCFLLPVCKRHRCATNKVEPGIVAAQGGRAGL